MKTESEVLAEIVDFFVRSADFNGIPLTKLAKQLDRPYLEMVDMVASLVTQDLVTIQRGTNPHIIGVALLPPKQQLEMLTASKENVTEVLMELPGGIKIESDSHTVCVYPTRHHLETVRDTTQFAAKPFTRELSLGEPQLKPLFFHIDVLERYFKDPRYSFEFDDYSGSIFYVDSEQQPTLLSGRDQFF